MEGGLGAAPESVPRLGPGDGWVLAGLTSSCTWGGKQGKGGGPRCTGDRGVPATHWCDRLRSGQALTDANCCSSSTMRRPMYPEDSSTANILGDRPVSGTGVTAGQEQCHHRGPVCPPWGRSGQASAGAQGQSGTPGCQCQTGEPACAAGTGTQGAVPKPRGARAGPGDSQQQVDEDDGIEGAQMRRGPGP